MFPVDRVDVLHQQAPVQTLPWFVTSMQDPTMSEILKEGPNRDPRQIKTNRQVWMARVPGDNPQHDHGIATIEGSQRIKHPARDTGLIAFVSTKALSGQLGCRQNLVR